MPVTTPNEWPRRPKQNTQTAAVLRALRRKDGLTVASAFQFGCCHLPAVVLRLRRGGHRIDAVWATGVNRYGRAIRFKKYRSLSQ